jgi:acyl carrier protein
MMEELELELKHFIVESLMLSDVKPEEIDSEAPLFVDGLGLDSIDALELAMAVSKKYGVNIKADDEENRKIFGSTRALAAFIHENRREGGSGS